MNLILWSLALLSAILATHWGADHLSSPLQKLRKRWELSEAAGAQPLLPWRLLAPVVTLLSYSNSAAMALLPGRLFTLPFGACHD